VTERSMRAFARAGAAGCGIVLLVLAADYFLQPEDLPLLALATAAALAVIACASWALWPLRKVPTDRQVARFVEEHCPELEDRLVSATELGPAGASSVFHDLVLADAASRTRTLDPRRVVSPSALRRSILRGAVVGLTLLIVSAIGLGPAGRVARVAWLYALPFTVSMEVTPGDAKVMSGQPLRIQARLGGSIGAPARSLPELTMITADGERTVEMRPADGGYRFDLASVTTSFKYRITAGTVSSKDFAVTALAIPHVKQVDVEYSYPAFTGLSPRVEADSGDIFAPAGTRVTLTVRPDKPVEAGTLVMDDGTRVALARRGELDLATSFDVEADGSYRIALVDREGLSNPGETNYFIRITLDRPPEIQITRPDGDREITPLEEVVIEARAEDDYGVEEFELVYSVVGGAERAIPLDRSGRAPTRSGSHTIFTEDLEVQPGDFIAYYARARDGGRGRRSIEARSDLFFLEVRPFDQQFEAMQSQGAMAQDAGDIGNLASVEKEIIAATWKMDRRASPGSARASTGSAGPEPAEGRPPAGERAEDIRAIARAQGELKETTARLAERVLARGRTLTPENRGRRGPENEAMSKAVEAMDRAESTLEALTTAAALPHEMEALNQLLKAQAEIRRKQVAMQQGNQGSGAGMNRATEDLSQLFDRELKKDQQTNYETRASQEQQENQESEARKKVRELADRQEALKREQDKLAEQAMAEEELKRQLDRLTREQNELRRQLEDLSKQLAAMRQGQQGQGQSGSQGQQTDEIADQMRRAMNELRRRDPGQASQHSNAALERLRELERQLQGNSRNERRQALGELQLEAQQLADAERRLASETREAQAGNGGRETRRRLATEEDQLADRVDTLENRVEDLLPRAGAEERKPLEAARADLGREAVGAEMRRLADRLRQTLAPEGAEAASRELAQIAGADERLASVLDRVADRLAAASQSAEERRLSEELRQAQQLRQRLQELEQKLEQGQGGDAGNQPPPDVDPSRAPDNKKGAQVVQAGADPQHSPEGRPEQMRPDGSTSGVGELARLQEEFLRQLQESPELVEQLRQHNPEIRQNLEDWAKHWMVTSAPGTEAFKQDFSSWESLRRDIRLALDEFEAARVEQLTEQEIQDRVNAGSDERLPERYRRLVEKYYQSLATRPGR